MRAAFLPTEPNAFRTTRWIWNKQTDYTLYNKGGGEEKEFEAPRVWLRRGLSRNPAFAQGYGGQAATGYGEH